MLNPHCQTTANAYWADKDYKKWVVEFTRGPVRKRERRPVNVGARDATAARRAGIAAMVLMGHTWARSAASTVRLATAYDLGCVAVETKGGAA